MVDEAVVVRLLADLEHRLERIEAFRSSSATRLFEDETAREVVSFNLMQAVQLCQDIGAHTVSDEGWRVASSYWETFERLAEKGVISTQTGRALARAAGFRNIVAHTYRELDPEALFAAATQGANDLQAFVREVGTWLKRRGEGL
jgi:uncharacterized protein YutE (UPF0331/DUF86 family)